MSAVIPLRREEVTAAWVQALLRESGSLADSARVVDLQVDEIGVGRGYVGLTLRLRPTYEPTQAGPASLVAKLPTFVEMTRESDKALIDQLYVTEIHWYRSYGASCPIPVPACYWSGIDAENGRFCLVLEDLGDLRLRDQLGSCSAEDARLAVSTLARAHAHWWGDPSLLAQDWLMDSDAFTEMWHPLYLMGWELFWSTFGGALPAEYEPIGSAINRQLPALVARSDAWTLLHGDYRLENFMFGPEGSAQIHVLDWQVVSIGSGARDLAYFMSQNLTTELRRSCEPELLALYHRGLVEGGVSGYESDQLYDDYRAGLLLATAIPVNAARFFEEQKAQGGDYLSPDERELFDRALDAGEVLVKVMAERNVAAILDNKAQELLAPR